MTEDVRYIIVTHNDSTTFFSDVTGPIYFTIASIAFSLLSTRGTE